MKKVYILIICSLIMLVSCAEKQLEPITESLGKPTVPTEISVEPISGGVVISYRVPDVEDILGVKAVYSLADGKQREVISSYYNDRVRIVGYDDMEEHKAVLYTVNRAMELSDPVTVEFIPLESSISKVSKSMRIVRDFGGAQYSWNNEDRESITMEMLTNNELGDMEAMKIMTTASKTGTYALRGYNVDPRWFAAVLRDNYGNVSDTIYPRNELGEKIQIAPMYEQKLDKSPMRVVILNNDAAFNDFGASNENLIDDNLDTFGHSSNGTMPASVTIDLGEYVKLSRVVIHQRNNEYYGWGNPRTFEVYYSENEPDRSGDWGQWTKLLDCEVIKPSGMSSGTNTDEDIEAAKEGHDFSFDIDQKTLRYLRFKFTKVWTSSTFCHPAELTFYGDPNVE